ncbi:MAG: hypothetical protein V3T05_12130 [Myxococcota bacterium]
MLEFVSQPIRVGVGKTPPRGRLVGRLLQGEDLDEIEPALVLAPRRIQSGELTLLTHAEHLPDGASIPRANRADQMLSDLRQGTLKRYVFSLQTSAGRRIVKIAEARGVGNKLLGALGGSISRREHAHHRIAEKHDIAASRGCGFLEWRAGAGLIRSCHLQKPIPDGVRSLGLFLPEQLDVHGDAALDSLAVALAASHAVPFFHADLKAFHAFVDDVETSAGAPATYRLRWLDLARASFRLSRRRRIINLYQTLRWIVPRRPEAEKRFIHAYCRASGWYADAPDRALRSVRRFLDAKLRTHQP